MIEISSHIGEGFAVAVESGEWKIGLLRYCERFSKLSEMERHLETDEAFVLLAGSATLFTDSESVLMKSGHIYNIPMGEWHHIVVSPDATVLVVENRNTTKQNTEKKQCLQAK